MYLMAIKAFLTSGHPIYDTFLDSRGNCNLGLCGRSVLELGVVVGVI